jgi:hypothetical protein
MWLVSEQYLMMNSSLRNIAGGSPPDPGPCHVDFGLVNVGGEAVTHVVF